MQSALRPDLVDRGAKGANADAKAPAVVLQLLLTRPARADAAAQPGEFGAASPQPRQEIAQLGQFHLQLPLPTPSATGKNIENQLGSIDHPQVQLPLQVAQLRGREVMVEDDQVGAGGLRGTPQLVHFASPQQGCRVGLRRPLEQGAHDARAGSQRQLAEFPKRILGIGPARNPPQTQRGFPTCQKSLLGCACAANSLTPPMARTQ